MVLQLRVVRMASGETLFGLAQKCGVAQTKLSMVERGIIQATPEEQKAIGHALGVNPDVLFREVSVAGMCRAESAV